MEIGVVVHGPGIVDSGWAKKIIDILSNFGNVHCRLGGTMGRTAVIDAGLEDVIDISLKLLPSQSLELFNREHADVIFLLNYGKSPETGRVFGYKVFTHYFKQLSNEDFLATNHKSLYESSIPVIQIERPGEEDGAIISWNCVLNQGIYDWEDAVWGAGYQGHTEEDICVGYFGSEDKLLQLAFHENNYLYQKISDSRSNFDDLFEENQLCLFS